VNFEDIALHKGVPIPLYRQIAAAIRDAIMQETLAPGERLPPIRTLAQVLGVSQVTASQAYDLLLAEGAIGSHVGRGTFVINPEGQIKLYEVHDNGIGRDATELLRKVKAAQYVASHPGEVCPAKWNEGAKTLKPSLDLVGKI